MRALTIAFTLLLATSPGFAGSIGLYADAEGTGCSLSVEPGNLATAYVVARTSSSDPFDGVIVGGEFRIVGLPSSWLGTATPVAAISASFGDPLGNGVTFGWPTAQPSGTTPLFTIAIMATTDEADLRLDVVQHVNPGSWNPTTCHSLVYACEPPCDVGGVCADGVSLFVNGPCGVRVEGATWSSVRSMYR